MMMINSRKSNRGIFYSLLALLLMLCVIQSMFQLAIPPVILLGIAVIMAIAGDHNEIIALCICCIPLHASFEYAYAVLAGLGVYVIKYGGRIRFNLSIVPVCLMILWEIIHCFGESFSIVHFAGRCLPLLLAAVLMCSKDSEWDYAFISRAFILSTVGVGLSLIGKMLYAADYNLVNAFMDLRRFGVNSHMIDESVEVVGGEVNPNTLGIICVLGMTAIMQLRYARIHKRSDSYLLVLLILFGVMTASRTFLVCLVCMVVLLIFSREGGIDKKIQFIVSAILFSAASIFVLNLFTPNLLENFRARFQEVDQTGGRMGLMRTYHEFIISSLEILLFGIGLHSFEEKVVDIFKVASVTPHNGFQELVIEWGIPGILLFSAFLLSIILRSKKNCKKQGLINYIPFLILLLKIQAGQMLSSSYTMLAFSFAYLSMCANLTPEARMQNEGTDQIVALSSDAFGVDFGRAVVALMRSSLVIAAVSLGSAVAAYGIARFVATPMYQSSALLYVNNRNISVDDSIRQFTSGDIYVSRRLVNSYAVILKARDTLNQVIEYADLDLSYEELRDMIRTSIVNETEVFRVTITSDDPVEAERIANSIAVVLPERISEIIQGASTKVVDYAIVASKPSSPNKRESAMLGFMFGFVLSFMIVLIAAMMDTTIHEEEDINGICEYPLLAQIPDLASESRE